MRRRLPLMVLLPGLLVPVSLCLFASPTQAQGLPASVKEKENAPIPSSEKLDLVVGVQDYESVGKLNVTASDARQFAQTCASNATK